MEDIIRVADRYYILANSALVEHPTRILKNGETFGVFDSLGDLQAPALNEHGIFHEGTRFLSQMELRVNGDRPLLLSSMVGQDSVNLLVNLTNPDIYRDGTVMLARESVHLHRSKFLWEGNCYERIRIHNFLLEPTHLILEMRFHADYSDIFEVRGMRRQERGKLLEPLVTDDSATMRYRGLDGIIRQSRLQFSPTPTLINGKEATFEFDLGPKQEFMLFITLECQIAKPSYPKKVVYERAMDLSTESFKSLKSLMVGIHSSNEQFNDWVNKATDDLAMIITETPHGLYPYAGIPWFNTAFGRDGIITALQCLWVIPELARGVLKYLAATQAREHLPAQDAQPGKILHEVRNGEMANLNEIPFSRYYGTVDATPLFIILAGAYFDHTGDMKTIEEIWEALELALEWIDRYGDLDGDGFVEYDRQAENGLVQQGWKDSNDSVFHANGQLAEGPIALCEVQGYVYAAKSAASRLAEARGRHPLAAKLSYQAEELREAFERAFWLEELGTYALALDGRKNPCRVRTSNPGHCLYSGIVSEERAARVAESLLAPDQFTGWGVRTISSKELPYNPMSYHNGSVWPHDNALLAQGLSRYGLMEEVIRLFQGMMDASLFMEQHRLPELFCGFHRRKNEGPTRYPVACSPQAWAIGTVFMMLQACVGLSVHPADNKIIFRHSRLPQFIEWIRFKNLRIGSSGIDILLRREGRDVSFVVENKDDELEVVVIK